jgi:hypothetical protein
MTNAPADLLSLHAAIMRRTGLTAVEVGIVGDAAHGGRGYHEGRTDLTRAGVINTDYSVRLARDRAGLTESASAMDIGANWRTGGRAAWLRFNALFVADLHANNPALAAVRATNYSPDGTARRRTDREAGWSVVSSSDVVDIHTHIEWYRDTEGRRQASLDRIDALIAAAIANQPASKGTDMLEDSPFGQDAGFGVLALLSGADPTGRKDRAPNWLAEQVRALVAGLATNATRDAATLAAIQALASGGTSIDTKAVIDAINAAGAAESAAVQALQTELADTRAKLAAALAAAGRALQA